MYCFYPWCSDCFDEPPPQHGPILTHRQVGIDFRNLFSQFVFQYQTVQTAVEEMARVPPRDNVEDHAFLHHSSRSIKHNTICKKKYWMPLFHCRMWIESTPVSPVMKIGKSKGNLMVNGQKILLAVPDTALDVVSLKFGCGLGQLGIQLQTFRVQAVHIGDELFLSVTNFHRALRFQNTTLAKSKCSVNQWLHPSIQQSIHWSINESIEQSANQLINQSNQPSIDQSSFVWSLRPSIIGITFLTHIKTYSAVGVGIHFHMVRVYRGIDDDPRPAAQLSKRRYVDEHRLPIGGEAVHNVRAKLQHLIVHVLHPAGKAAPIGENHQRQLLVVEVLDGLGGLVGRIGIPHLTGLLNNLQEKPNVKLFKQRKLKNQNLEKNLTVW